MKKFLILIAAGMLAAQISNAQTRKGAQTLGGLLSFTHGLTSNLSVDANTSMLQSQKLESTNFSIGPAYSYFLADKLELGGLLSYSTGKTSSTGFDGSVSNIQKQNSNSFGGALYLRKYCLYNNKIGIRTGPYISYFRGDTKSTLSGTQYPALNNTSNNKSNTYNAGADVDLVYYPSGRLGLAATLASLTYSNAKVTYPNSPQTATKVESVGFDFINSGLTLTAFYVFGAK